MPVPRPRAQSAAVGSCRHLLGPAAERGRAARRWSTRRAGRPCSAQPGGLAAQHDGGGGGGVRLDAGRRGDGDTAPDGVGGAAGAGSTTWWTYAARGARSAAPFEVATAAPAGSVTWPRVVVGVSWTSTCQPPRGGPGGGDVAAEADEHADADAVGDRRGQRSAAPALAVAPRSSTTPAGSRSRSPAGAATRRQPGVRRTHAHRPVAGEAAARCRGRSPGRPAFRRQWGRRPAGTPAAARASPPGRPAGDR